MTVQEAIKAIENNRPTHGYTILCEALDIAIEALEKQIPKKPNMEREDMEGNIIERCPVCFSMYIDVYCSKCGQLIDWGE